MTIRTYDALLHDCLVQIREYPTVPASSSLTEQY